MNPIDPVIMEAAGAELIQHPQSGIVLMHSDGEIIYASSTNTQLFGWVPEELVGNHFTRLIATDDVKLAGLAIQDALLNDQSVEVTARVRSKSGEYVAVRGQTRRLTDRDTGEIVLLARYAALPVSQ